MSLAIALVVTILYLVAIGYLIGTGWKLANRNA